MLVATSVIEVGIDVPNATVMMIEAAERYGLSQLHQLRGRVGRGEHASLCILFGDPRLPRLEALASERDGFRLAEVDLELRGAGDVLGTRQHGLPEFRVARLPEDVELLERARAARRGDRSPRDPELAEPEHAAAARRALRLELDPIRHDAASHPHLLSAMRVVAGAYKGRRLHAPPGSGTRPTADRVREALFSILGDVDGRARARPLRRHRARSASRRSRAGAASAVFVERDAARGRRRSSAIWRPSGRRRRRVRRQDVLRFLAARAGDVRPRFRRPAI